MTINGLNDTICAPASAVGGGAITVLRVSGPDCFAIVDSVVSFRHGNASSAPGQTLKYGSISDGGRFIDDVVVGIYRAPHSYTGEDSAELFCHASRYIASEILRLLVNAGCRPAEAGEYTRRAFLNGKMDLAQAEAVADVISSSSEASHRIAVNQMRGGYSAELRALRAQMLELCSLLELELDFSEEELEFADRSRLDGLMTAAAAKCRRLAESFRLGNAIKNGVPVAIVGAPNSGKSTLLNRLVGEDRAIVSDIPGTTRDTVEECCVIGGVNFRFIDTAGIRDASDEIERLGIGRTFDAIGKASVVLAVVDVMQPEECVRKDLAAVVAALSGEAGGTSGKLAARKLPGAPDFEGGDTVTGAYPAGENCGSSDGVPVVQRRDVKVIVLGNKVDMDNAADLAGVDGNLAGFDANSVVNIFVNNYNNVVSSSDLQSDMLLVSAKTGFGIEKLENALSSAVRLPENDEIMVTNARHAAAISTAADRLDAALAALRSGLPADLLSEDVRDAISTLGSITGEITTDEVLGEIFGKFCIGK